MIFKINSQDLLHPLFNFVETHTDIRLEAVNYQKLYDKQTKFVLNVSDLDFPKKTNEPQKRTFCVEVKGTFMHMYDCKNVKNNILGSTKLADSFDSILITTMLNL